jgi:hypothetical protein
MALTHHTRTSRFKIKLLVYHAASVCGVGTHESSSSHGIRRRSIIRIVIAGTRIETVKIRLLTTTRILRRFELLGLRN